MSTITAGRQGAYGRHQGDGLIRTIDGGAELYMLMPSQPSVRDAAGWEDRLKAARPWYMIMSALADLIPDLPVNSRRLTRGLYRRVHILAVASPRRYTPSPTLDPATRTRLARDHADLVIHDRFTLFGVRLHTGGGERERKNLRQRWYEATAESEGETPDEAFRPDMERVRTILENAGCRTPDDDTMRRAFAWWPMGDQNDPTPIMAEPGHLHLFPNHAACDKAEYLRRTTWDCSLLESKVDGMYTATIANLGVLPFRGEREDTPGSDWASTLLASRDGGGAGAIAVSITGLVEPGWLSREQIDRDKMKVLDKAEEQAMTGHNRNLNIADELGQASLAYARDGKPWPTLIEGNAQVCLPYRIDNPKTVPYPGHVELNRDRQHRAFNTMLLGSAADWNPSPVLWPTPILAFAGLNSRSFAGDDTGTGQADDMAGALVGLTEADRIPVYDSPWRASRRHERPITLITGSTGSGKTRLGLHLAAQYGRLPAPDGRGRRIPVVFWDPKRKSSDFSGYVTRRGGRVVRFDDRRALGVLDPLRAIPADMPDLIQQTGVNMLSQILSGQTGDRDREIAIGSMIGYGRRHGARSLGDAIDLSAAAVADHATDAAQVSPHAAAVKADLDRLAVNDPLMPLLYAHGASGTRLNAGEGMTLLSAGALNIIPDKTEQTAVSAVQRWVCRMGALAGSALVMRRDGALVIDEAWSLLSDEYGRGLARTMGRLARDQHYMVMMLSQKASDFTDARLGDYVGKMYALAIGGREEGEGRMGEADAVCRLMHQPTDGRLHTRLMEDAVVDGESNAPNPDGLYALRDPETGVLLRGSVAYMQVGGQGAAIPVEIRIDPSLE